LASPAGQGTAVRAPLLLPSRKANSAANTKPPGGQAAGISIPFGR
jgi:hypothetical protein